MQLWLVSFVKNWLILEISAVVHKYYYTYCEMFINTYCEEHLWMAASEHWIEIS